MQRAAVDRSRTVRVWRQHVARHDGVDACVCERQVGRFRKGQKVGGCGKPRCYLCHADKLDGINTPQQLRALVRYREGMLDVLAAVSNPTFQRTAARPLN
jgi:hypothetical protein